MKLLETLLLTSHNEYRDEILSVLPIESNRVMEIDVARLEVDPELIIIVYQLELNQRFPAQFLEHIRQHLFSLLVILNPSSMENFLESFDIFKEFDLSRMQVVIAIRVDEETFRGLEGDIDRIKAILPDHARICHWLPEDQSSLKRVWQLLWVEIGKEKDEIEPG